jgi:hypothetical protein
MVQEDGSLKVEQNFLIQPRFQWSPWLFGRLLCGSVTPRCDLWGPIEGWGEISRPGCVKLPVPSWSVQAFMSFLLLPHIVLVLCWKLLQHIVFICRFACDCCQHCQARRPASFCCWMFNIPRFSGNSSSLGWFARLAGPLLSKLSRCLWKTKSQPLIDFLLLADPILGPTSNGEMTIATRRVERINTMGCCLLPWANG